VANESKVKPLKILFILNNGEQMRRKTKCKRLAQRDGMIGEEFTHQILGGQIVNLATHDIEVGEVPIEVKTVQLRVKANGSKRFGQFKFKLRQQQYLENHSGYYMLVVLDGKKLDRFRLVEPSLIHRHFNGSQEISVNLNRLW
jgi:transcriptional regulator of met regulon